MAMHDRLEKTATSLAVVEKKPQRPGGCAGIFFQLFDWNRRFAKKKLFSKKLIPPVRLKQASKKFGGDEKQPKLRLIADENSGGFPPSKNNNGVNKVDSEQKNETRVPGLVARLMGLDSMPSIRREKFKKIGASSFASGEKEKPIGNLFEEGLNVEKGGIKHESRPQKLQKTSVCERQPVTRFGPVGNLPFKNVLSKSRKHHHHHPKLPSPVKSPRNLSRKNSSKLIGAATRILEPGLQTSRPKCGLTYSNMLHPPPQKAVMEEDSCRNCGYLESKLSCKDQPVIFSSPFSHRVGSLCHEVERNNPGQPAFYDELEKLHDYHGNFQPVVKLRSYNSPFSEQIHRNLDNQQSKPPKGIQRTPHRPKTNVAKNFVSANQTLSGRGSSTRLRMPVRMENGKFESEKRITNRLNEPVPIGRKRRTTNLSKQGESSSFTVNKQSLGSSNALMFGKQLGYNAHSVNQRHNGNNNNAISSAFHSSAKHKPENDLHCAEKLALGENGGKKIVKPLPLSGDALGAILEQKLKELTSQGEDVGGNVPKKTTATILQELISALTTEIPFQQDNMRAMSNSTSSSSSQANGMAVKIHVDQQPDMEHLSPGSVLDPYFSTESCVSSSMDDSLGCKVLTESSELLDSAASVNTFKSSNELVLNILNNVSELLSCSDLGNFKGNKLDRANEVLLNAELVCHNTKTGFSIKHLLVDELETLASILWMNFGPSLGLEDSKEANQLKAFVLDSIMEYLDLRFGRCPHVGSKVSGKLPARMMNSNILILEIVEAVKRWGELCRLSADGLIEREMSLSLGEWTECESEVFENGVEISRYLLEVLMDEILIDLSQPC